jgi:hypothetical protein
MLGLFWLLAAGWMRAGENLLVTLAPFWPENENVLGLVDAHDRGLTVATYEVRFDAVWSGETHPAQFPPGPHFSGLIGGTHHAAVSFWLPGQNATPGIQNMAETGSKFPLTTEVQDAIAGGTAGVVLSGGGIPLSPGNVSLVFDIDRANPMVSLVSMIAPSPDWFVGVHGLALYGDGDWMDERVAVLYPYDAGTDSGVTYTSANSATTPPVPIFRIEEDPFLNNGNVAPLGTFTFSLIGVAAP